MNNAQLRRGLAGDRKIRPSSSRLSATLRRVETVVAELRRDYA